MSWYKEVVYRNIPYNDLFILNAHMIACHALPDMHKILYYIAFHLLYIIDIHVLIKCWSTVTKTEPWSRDHYQTSFAHGDVTSQTWPQIPGQHYFRTMRDTLISLLRFLDTNLYQMGQNAGAKPPVGVVLSDTLTHRGPVDLRKWAIFNTILMSPKSWLSQEDLDVDCEHSMVPMDS